LRSKSIEKELAQKNEVIQKLTHELEVMKKRYDEKDKFETEILSNHQNNLSNNIKILRSKILI
jgi:hypothetical protein